MVARVFTPTPALPLNKGRENEKATVGDVGLVDLLGGPV